MGRRGFVKDKILLGLEAGTLARIKRVIPKKMSRGAFIRDAIEDELAMYELAGRYDDDAKRLKKTVSKR